MAWWCTERAALTHLADVTGGDVRSCISTLQFLSRRSDDGPQDAGIKLQDVRGAAVGMKDKARARADGGVCSLPLPRICIVIRPG
jgi:hypothetical protein